MIPTQITIFRCPKCLEVMTEPEYDGYGNDYCTNPECGHEINRTKDAYGQRPVGYVSIAAYVPGREYGGPEEGGWYYDTGYRIDESLRCFPLLHGPFNELNTSEAEKYLKELKESPEYDDCRVRVYAEVVAPRNFPEVRPRYC